MTTSIDDIRDMLGSARGGRHPCPVCGAKHSVSVAEGSNGKPLVNCHAQNCDVWSWLKKHGAPARVQPTKGTQSKLYEEVERLCTGVHILRAATLAKAGKPKTYLRGRGITIEAGSALLMPASVSATTALDKHYPAMVNPIIKDDLLVGAHTTLLSKDGTTRIKDHKRSWGVITGGYVPLGTRDPKKPLIVAEGIETALSAMQIAGIAGGVATCGTSGMKAVELPPSSEVIIAADPGDGGQKAARLLAERLAADGTRVRIATPKRGDWNDRLQRVNGDRDALAILKRKILRAPIVKMQAFEDDDGAMLSMGDFLDLDLPPQKYLVEPILREKNTTFLTARAGDGKTRLALSLAYALATGTDLMEWHVPKAERVMYIDAELPPEQFRDDMLARLGPRHPNLCALNAVHSAEQGYPAITIGTDEGRKYLRSKIERFDPKLVIIDSLTTATELEMSDGKAKEDNWPEIARFLKLLKNEGRHVMLLHHNNKSGSQYGSSLKEIGFDLQILMERAERFNTKELYAFKLWFEKARRLPVEQKIPRIVTVPSEGTVEWQRTGHNPEAPGRRADPERDARVLELYDTGEYTLKKIADTVGLSAPGVRKILRRHGRLRAEGN